MSNLDTNHVISLDLIKDRANAVIKFGLPDVETSDFYLGLYNNGTRIFDENYIVTLYIVKPNGTFRNIKLEPKEGLKKYYCNLPDTLKNIPGEYLCQAIIFDNLANEKKVSKSKFKYSVDLDLASEIAGIIGEEEQESILTNILNRLLTLENPVEPYATQKHVDECVSALTEEIDAIKVKDTEQDGKLVDIESKNTEQDNRLNIIETKDIEQDNRLTSIETKDVEQDNRLSGVESKNIEQDEILTSIEEKNTEQDERLVNIESKNTKQDNRLTSIETKDVKQDEKLNLLENKVDGIGKKIVDTIEPSLDNYGNRLDALETKDIIHDSRMTNIESKNTEQDNRLTSIEEINTTQDNRLDGLESKDMLHESKITDIETKNTEQDERLNAVETKNTEQDGRLDIAENRLANIGNDITGVNQKVDSVATLIPTNTSQLTNDSDFVNSTFVTDKIAEASLSGGEVDLSGYQTRTDNTLNTKDKTIAGGINEIKASVDSIEIPTKTSDLINDSGYLTEHQSLDSYAKTEDIPTNISQLTNDAGFITLNEVPVTDLSGYVTKEVGNANQITFTDGQTFQAKLDAGMLKGDKGDRGLQGIQGEKGEKGDKGDAFIYEDFTPEQLASLKGEQGIQGVKGDKGDQGEQGIQGEKGDTGEQGIQGEKGDTGQDGTTFTPSVDAEGNLSWTNDKGLANPITVNIKGEKGDPGVNNIDDNNASTTTIYSSYKIENIKEDLSSQIKDITNKVVTVKDFGAKGDGITDDTEAINLAIQSTKKIIFPKGTYIVSSPLVLKDNTVIAGEGYTSILKCSNTFNGTELIRIIGVKNTEIKDISLNGGSVFNWDTKEFSSLNGNIKGILIDKANSHVAVCRISNVEINLFSTNGIYVAQSSYEVIVNTVVIKTCYLSGIYNRGTDGHWSNIYIGLCGYDSSNYLKEGAHLEGQNNNYLNFKVYLCNYGGVYLERGTSYNNYSNFNIQECKKYGLNINTATYNNLTNMIIDSCENGINMYQTSGIFISGLVSNCLSTISTNLWLCAYNCGENNYVDILALVGTKSSDNVNITYLKSS